MNRMLKRFPQLLILTVILTTLFSVSASADTGPKPSVTVEFENIGDELCYGVLLSEKEWCGPYDAWDGTAEDARHNGNELYYYVDLTEEMWRPFAEYEDPDGYYYLQSTVHKVNETGAIEWNYYPPERFKILLYYPESGEYLSSGICESYAFDSHYTVDMASLDSDEDGRALLEVRETYKWQAETVSLIARIIITVAVELVVGLVFGIWGKSAFITLLAVNTVTQIILNVLVNIINFTSGQYAFVAGYILLEIIVFIIEAVAYAILLMRLPDNPKPAWLSVLYAWVANTLSLVVGIYVAVLVPGIF